MLDCFEDLQAIINWERCATGTDVTGNYVTGSHVTGSEVNHVSGSDVIHVTESDVSHVAGSDVLTGSDVIFPALFSYHSSSTKCPIVVCHSIYGF